MLHIKACRQRVCVLEFISFEREVTLQRCAGAAPCRCGCPLPVGPGSSQLRGQSHRGFNKDHGRRTYRKEVGKHYTSGLPAPSPWW